MHRIAACAAGLLLCAGALAAEDTLRICADPDNLPFSHADGTGFENRIARLVADDLHATLAYEWLPQIRGYVRKTMGAGLCDVFIGVPAGFERVLTTKPYYRSTYVFVSRRDAGRAPLASFDDARLPALAIGVQLPGNDLAATPPGHALALKGAIDNVTGFPLIGAPPSAARIVAAIDAGTLDAGVLWGPQAAWYVRQAKTPLALVPARPPQGLKMPFEFGIAMGVRRGDKALRDRLDDVIVRRRADIDAILAAYDVPRTDRQP